jgi:integrase/recombinase XerC
MSGRQEQDLKYEQWIKEHLESQPMILKDYMLSIKKKTSSTRKAYLRYLIQYVDYMESQNIKLTDVIPMYIDRYIEYISEGNGPCIVNAKLSAVISFYNFLEENGLVQKNPCPPSKKLKVDEKETVVYMTEREVRKIKSNVTYNQNSVRDNCIVTLGIATGLRVSAIVNIDIEDIDFDNKTIKVIEKGDKERIVYIGDNTINSIKQWIEVRRKKIGTDSGALFISNKNKRISVRRVEEMIQAASQNIDKHITPHKMRSTCAMKLYNKTGDIYLTAQQLGHKNIKNTMIYAKSTEEKRREAALILD